MIQFLLLQNRQGKTRLSKYYRSYGDEEKVKLEAEIHRTVTTRDPKFTNFVEWRQYKLIYRRYAGLFFTLCVDQEDNELVYFESIHLFVELLDSYFSNVCELDLVFNFNKVYMILDEFFAGEAETTSRRSCAGCGSSASSGWRVEESVDRSVGVGALVGEVFVSATASRRVSADGAQANAGSAAAASAAGGAARRDPAPALLRGRWR